MKGWVWGIILLSLCGRLMKSFLPRGEKSPLFAPLRFLLSLCLIAILFSPFFKFMGGKAKTDKTIDFKIDEAYSIDGDALVLEQMGKTIKRSVDTAFPHHEFTLEIYTDQQGLPNLIKVVGGGQDGSEIADFIQRNYGLDATAE